MNLEWFRRLGALICLLGLVGVIVAGMIGGPDAAITTTLLILILGLSCAFLSD